MVELYVRTLTGKRIKLEVDLSHRVADIKGQIEDMEGEAGEESG